MKILYLTARQPYPYTKGDQILAYNQIKYLSKNHEVYLISYYKDNKEVLLKEMHPYCKKIYLFKDSNLKQLLSSLKTIFNLNSIQANCFYRYYKQDHIQKILRILKPDVVHIQSFRMAEYFMNYKGKKSIDLIDAYSWNMENRIYSEKNLIKKILWKLEHVLLMKYENKILRNYDIKFINARRDQQHLGDDQIIVNSMGVSLDSQSIFAKKAEQKNHSDYNILFHGNMSYYPNVQAIQCLVNQILPKLIVKNKKIKLYLVGGNVCNDVKALASDQVIVTGYVEKLEPYFAIADVEIFPIKYATGLQTKLIEAMYAKVPTIISPECARGLEQVKHRENTLIAKDLDDYAMLLNELMNHSFCNTLTDNAYQLVYENYSWDKHVGILESAWIK